MFGQISPDIILLLMLYAVGAAMAFIACVYLLFRRGNAFVSDIVTPVRLRRWTAAFFASLALGHEIGKSTRLNSSHTDSSRMPSSA